MNREILGTMSRPIAEGTVHATAQEGKNTP
jgi:hypothetical protein